MKDPTDFEKEYIRVNADKWKKALRIAEIRKAQNCTYDEAEHIYYEEKIYVEITPHILFYGCDFFKSAILKCYFLYFKQKEKPWIFHGFSMVAGVGLEPHDLRVIASRRFAVPEKGGGGLSPFFLAFFDRGRAHKVSSSPLGRHLVSPNEPRSSVSYPEILCLNHIHKHEKRHPIGCLFFVARSTEKDITGFLGKTACVKAFSDFFIFFLGLCNGWWSFSSFFIENRKRYHPN